MSGGSPSSRPPAGRDLGPGARQLSLRTPTLPPATATNTLILGRSRLLVVEPATPHGPEQAQLDEALDQMVAEGREVVGVIVTHHHADHIGYADALRRRHAVPLFAHPQTAARLPFAVDLEVDEGWQLDLGEGHVVEAWHTPGHAPGHLVVVDHRGGVAHAGDLVAGVGTILVDPHDAGDMGDYLASLARVRDLLRGRETRLVPAHGPVIDDPVSLLEGYIAHRRAREARVMAAVEAGHRELDDLLAVAYDDTPRSLWPLARRALEAHLHLLVRDGRVTWHGDLITAR